MMLILFLVSSFSFIISIYAMQKSTFLKKKQQQRGMYFQQGLITFLLLLVNVGLNPMCQANLMYIYFIYLLKFHFCLSCNALKCPKLHCAGSCFPLRCLVQLSLLAITRHVLLNFRFCVCHLLMPHSLGTFFSCTDI